MYVYIYLVIYSYIYTISVKLAPLSKSQRQSECLFGLHSKQPLHAVVDMLGISRCICIRNSMSISLEHNSNSCLLTINLFLELYA